MYERLALLSIQIISGNYVVFQNICGLVLVIMT